MRSLELFSYRATSSGGDLTYYNVFSRSGESREAQRDAARGRPGVRRNATIVSRFTVGSLGIKHV